MIIPNLLQIYNNPQEQRGVRGGIWPVSASELQCHAGWGNPQDHLLVDYPSGGYQLEFIDYQPYPGTNRSYQSYGAEYRPCIGNISSPVTQYHAYGCNDASRQGNNGGYASLFEQAVFALQQLAKIFFMLL